MSKFTHSRYLFLLLSAVFFLLAVNCFSAQRSISTIESEITELGHKILYLRDESIAFNSGYVAKPNTIKNEIAVSERDVEAFVGSVKEIRIDVFGTHRDEISSLVAEYASHHLTLASTIDNLINLVIARDSALAIANNDTSTQSAEPITANEKAERPAESYDSLNAEISVLMNQTLLGSGTEFVEHTEHAFKELGLKNLTASFLYSLLALICITGFTALSSRYRLKKLTLMNDELKKMTDEAKKANDAKSIFLATMSHELRTPMNGVLGMAQLIADDTQEETTKKNVQVINDSGEHLMTIINDILDFSKVEQGHLEFEKTNFKLDQVIGPVVNSLAPIANDKHIMLEVERDKIPANVSFSGDSSRLRQILFNIVGNAIKFTQNGGVKIICDYIPSEKNITFWIKDTGVGIPQEKIEHIFEPFRQADASTNRNFGGTGLGLSIVKGIVDRMDGHVSVVSREGVGSTFVISLPLESQLAAEGDGMPISDAQPESETKHFTETLDILIADDNAVNATVCKRLCEQLGHKVEIVENGRKAVDALSKKDYDLVLMDKHMPEMDGIEAIYQIRTKLKLPVIIFACTADVFREAHDEFLNFGANHVLTKPLQKSSLENAMLRFMDDFRELRNQRHSNDASNVVMLVRKPKQELPMTEEELSNSSVLSAFSDEIEELNYLLGLMQKEFEKASDNLIEGYENKDVETLFKTLHTVKGTALELDLPNLAEITRKNEEKSKNGELPELVTLQKILNLMSVNIHQSNRILDAKTTSDVTLKNNES